MSSEVYAKYPYIVLPMLTERPGADTAELRARGARVMRRSTA
jgi:hypothetical protein